jgi:uncharacterized membrane protein required for colicin V production
MGLDILCIALMAIFLVFGLLRGFLSQVIRLAALVGAFLLAHTASAYTKPLLTKWVQADHLALDLLSLFLGWVACYIAILLIGTVFARILQQSSTSIRFLDRILGGGLGSAKGFLIGYLIACALVLLREPLDNILPSKHLDLSDSRLAAFAGQHNVFSRVGIPYLEELKELASALHDRERQGALLQDPAVKELERNAAFRRLMSDPAFRKAMEERQWGAILNNPSLRAAINDPQVRRLLSSIDTKGVSRVPDEE